MSQEGHAIQDLMITAMARLLVGSRVVAGATYCSQAAAIVARNLYDPAIMLLTNYGMVDVRDVFVTPTRLDFFARSAPGVVLEQPEMFDFVLGGRMAIWIAPAQVDQFGSANIAYIGSHDRPKPALVGPRGLPDDGTNLEAMTYYVAMHSPRTIVTQVDHISSPGYVEARLRGDIPFGKPTLLVTNLGVFEFGDGIESPRLQAQSLHPGVTAQAVIDATPFAVEIPPDVATTTPPTADDVAAIEAADPFDCRRLEFLGGAEAAAHMQSILTQEEEFWSGAGKDASRPEARG